MNRDKNSHLALQSFSLRMKDQNNVILNLLDSNPEGTKHYRLFQESTLQLGSNQENSSV